MMQTESLVETESVLVEEQVTAHGRYALLRLRLWQAEELILYAEQGEEAAYTVLSQISVSRAILLLSRIARGELSPIQLSEVAADAAAPEWEI